LIGCVVVLLSSPPLVYATVPWDGTRGAGTRDEAGATGAVGAAESLAMAGERREPSIRGTKGSSSDLFLALRATGLISLFMRNTLMMWQIATRQRIKVCAEATNLNSTSRSRRLARRVRRQCG